MNSGLFIKARRVAAFDSEEGVKKFLSDYLKPAKAILEKATSQTWMSSMKAVLGNPIDSVSLFSNYDGVNLNYDDNKEHTISIDLMSSYWSENYNIPSNSYRKLVSLDLCRMENSFILGFPSGLNPDEYNDVDFSNLKRNLYKIFDGPSFEIHDGCDFFVTAKDLDSFLEAVS